jgi:hypothetical protein
VISLGGVCAARFELGFLEWRVCCEDVGKLEMTTAGRGRLERCCVALGSKIWKGDVCKVVDSVCLRYT